MLISAIIIKIIRRFFMKFNISVPLLGFEDIKQVELQKIDDIFMKMQSRSLNGLKLQMGCCPITRFTFILSSLIRIGK